MTISNDLYLDGFQKINCGEDGMVFVRYSKPEADERAAEIVIKGYPILDKVGKAEISKSPMYYGGRDTENYDISMSLNVMFPLRLSVPTPKERVINAFVAVIRGSKNRYTVTLYENGRLEFYKSGSIKEKKKICEQFFKK